MPEKSASVSSKASAIPKALSAPLSWNTPHVSLNFGSRTRTSRSANRDVHSAICSMDNRDSSAASPSFSRGSTTSMLKSPPA